ncbi:MAG: OmpA family protein [Candidatus Aminicenantes bacterium]|nr:OmpA family protein [Candidatus Aminicenantes bacterium]
MNKNKSILLGVSLVLIALIASVGCVTKKLMLEEVATLDQKVEGVQTSVEENQKRIKEHDERLSTLGSLITENETKLEEQKTELDDKINEVRRYAQGRLIFQEILKSDETTFQFDSSELSEEAQMTLDEFVDMLVAQDKGVYLEIQGHTDSSGPEAWNLLLSQKRAGAVMEYLHKKFRIPLHRMAVIGYGSADPIADNETREGRAKNRRVVILVFE